MNRLSGSSALRVIWRGKNGETPIGDEEGVSEASANGVVLNGKTARGRERVAGFLIQHLSKLPSLESYLTWQLLVDEHGESINLIEQMQMLSTFQAIMEHPVKLLAPEEEHSEEAIEALEKALRAIKLEESWCIWLNDYAERHPYNRKAWQHLSDTYERAHQLELAEKALQYITQMQLEQYQRNLQRGLAGQEIRYLRSNLIRLFEFYRRNTLPANGSAVFNTYYKALPELWDNHVAANKLLIDLTRPFMEGTLAAKAYKLPGGAASAWLPLQAELGNVYELAALKTLQKRLHRAIALLMASQKALREGLHEIRTLLDEVCALDAVRRQRGELQDEARLLNRRIQEACLLVRDENFAPLKALVAALQRVFGDFSTARQLVPQLQVQPTPLGYGLACDQPHTTLVVRVRNPGPGEVSNIRVTCSSEGRIVTRKEGVLSLLSEQGEGLIAIPVTTQLPPPGREYEQFGCQVHLHYQWGILQHLSSIQEVTVHWYSFQDFLQQHRIKDYEFPIPYVFDTAIDFHRHDRRLFQGREDEIQLIRSIFFKGQMKGAPLYFYGIRKVGKTSLLHRICLELEQGKFLPCVVDLHGIKAGQQTENVIVNTFTTRIVEQMAARGVNISGLRPVPVEQKNPLLEIERFLQGLRGRARERQIVLLLDEFHGLVAEHTAALLDLLRRVHQRDEILLIFSGWLHPSALQQACSQTQLFPLNAYAIDYLPLKVVRQVLQVPLADYGICIPEETLRQVYEQTAGNPYHVAKLAACGIALLNAEHRTVLAPQDVDEIAATLAKDPANFTSSSFSPLIFSPEEQNAAIRFAHDMNGREGLGREEASRIFDEVVVRRLEEKYLLERRDEGLAIRSRMLKAHLQSFQRPGTEPQLPRAVRRRVGIFVDYENLLPLLPAGMKAREVGEALIGHAARFGEVVCSWACADPRNIPDALGMRQGLEKAGFQVHYPRGEAHNGRVAKNLTDFALLERITDESAQSAPDTYLLVSGDRDYYEKIAALLDRGYVVRLVASTSNGHLAAKYVRLQEQRMQICHAEGLTKTDFFIDNLDEILQQAVEMLRK